MQATKTPVGVATLAQLIGYNDEFCYTLFADEEIRRGLAEFGPAVDALYSTDLFSNNSQAPRIQVPIASLRKFQKSHRSFAFAAYLIASYEVAADYYEQALELLRECGKASLVHGTGDSPEERFAASLANSGCGALDPNDVRTLTYIRKRRNHLVHLGAAPAVGFQDLCSNYGASMNAHWGPTREAVDFTVASTAALSEREAVGFLKLLRILIERLDAAVAAGIDNFKAVKREASRVRASLDRPNLDVLGRRAGELRHAVSVGYGLALTEESARSAMHVAT